MGRRRLGTSSLILGLPSIGLTLGVWAYIISQAPRGAFQNQGGLLITFILFPLTFLGWVAGGIGAIALGSRARRAGDEQSAASVGVILGVLGLLMSLGTLVVPEVLAKMVFGE
jgi:hypothetical protein